jgi:hypothetical protein
MDRDQTISILGEGIHTSLRKAGDPVYAPVAWSAIDNMPAANWTDVLAFLVDGLRSMGVELVDEPHKDDVVVYRLAQALLYAEKLLRDREPLVRQIGADLKQILADD